MKIKTQNQDWVNRNVMELLVKEEIDRQSCRLPSTISRHINLLEVATYALNRLPALYASSQQGFNRQKLRGKAEYSVEITQAVRRGFAAVQRDLLRHSIPLVESAEPTMEENFKDPEEVKRALLELSKYLPEGKFSRTEIVELIELLLAGSNPKDLNSARLKKMSCESSSEWESNSTYQK